MTTENRKKYLAGISIDETEARKLIEEFKITITDDKYALNSLLTPQMVKDRVRRDIKYCQHRIALVKKQLPAPKKHYLGNWYCPVCGYSYQGGVELYCQACGQKLRCKNE